MDLCSRCLWHLRYATYLFLFILFYFIFFLFSFINYFQRWAVIAIMYVYKSLVVTACPSNVFSCLLSSMAHPQPLPMSLSGFAPRSAYDGEDSIVLGFGPLRMTTLHIQFHVPAYLFFCQTQVAGMFTHYLEFLPGRAVLRFELSSSRSRKRALAVAVSYSLINDCLESVLAFQHLHPPSYTTAHPW